MDNDLEEIKKTLTVIVAIVMFNAIVTLVIANHLRLFWWQ